MTFSGSLAILALPLALILAQPASAASSRDVQSLENCVRDSARGASAEQTAGRCIGILSTACRDQNTLGIAECIMNEQAAWDTLLNAWWKPMSAQAKQNGSWDRLLASQRKWIKDRDAACERAYESAGGGSIRVIYGAECQLDMTARKAVSFYYDLYN